MYFLLHVHVQRNTYSTEWLALHKTALGKNLLYVPKFKKINTLTATYMYM